MRKHDCFLSMCFCQSLYQPMEQVAISSNASSIVLAMRCIERELTACCVVGTASEAQGPRRNRLSAYARCPWEPVVCTLRQGKYVLYVLYARADKVFLACLHT